MSERESQRDPSIETPKEELDTEGQAFKWALVDEKGKPRLRQSWTPDEPKPESAGGSTSGDRESRNKSR